MILRLAFIEQTKKRNQNPSMESVSKTVRDGQNFGKMADKMALTPL